MRFLGNIVVGANASVNNLTTATPFTIPVGCDSVVVLASGSDCYAEIKPSTSAMSTTAATGVPIGTSQYQLPAVSTAGAGYANNKNVLAVFNNNGASRTVQVWFNDAA